MTSQKTLLLNFLDKTNQISQLSEMAQEFSEKYISPINALCDKNNAFPNDLWKTLGNHGLLGITIPEEYGGINAGYLAHLTTMESVSHASGSIGLSYVAHSNLCANQIKLNGTNYQKRKYLPNLVSGDYVGALAMSEPNAGSDVISMGTTATKFEDGYLLNGQKLWITNGGTADVLVVYAKTEPAMGAKGITAFIVEKSMTGFKPGQKIDKMGMRGSETWELFFDNCFVPYENVLGDVNGGSRVLMSGLNYERLILSGGPLGLAQSALDYTCQYTSERKQFGKSLNSNQAMAHQLAEMHSNLSTIRERAYLNAAQADAGIELTNEKAASIFFEASDKATFITQRCITLCGGMGYTSELPLGQIYRDQMLYEIGGGARDIRLEVIARSILPAYNDNAKLAEKIKSPFSSQEICKCNNQYKKDFFHAHKCFP